MEHNPEMNFRTVRGYQLKGTQKDGLTPALEDYLEMAYRLCQKNQYTRITALAENLQVKPSSASKMVLKLVSLSYLQYDRYDSICLTEQGKEKGAYLLHRHDVISEFLTLVGNKNPLEETELIEHTLSPATIAKLKSLLDFFMIYPEIRHLYESFQLEKLSL